MRSNVEPRVAITHDIDQHENSVLMRALQAYRASDDLPGYELAMLDSMIEGLHEADVDADKLMDRIRNIEDKQARLDAHGVKARNEF